MNASARNELASIKRELNSIISELESISKGVKNVIIKLYTKHQKRKAQ